METTPAIQDYLGAIFDLAGTDQPVIGARLARHMHLSAPSITEALRRMQREIWIPEKLARKKCHVRAALANDAISLFRLTDHPYGSGQYPCLAADALRERHLVAGMHGNALAWIKSAAARVDQINLAGCLEGTRHCDGVLNIEAAVDPVGDREPHGQWQLLRPYGAHGAHGFQQETHAVLARAAITIRTLVAQWREKFMQQIAMAAVQLKKLKACLERTPRRITKARNHGFNQLGVHFARERKSVGVGQGRGRKHIPGPIRRGKRLRALPRARHRTFAARVRKLDTRDRPLARNEACNRAKPIALFVIPQSQAMFGDAAARFNMRCLDAHDARATDRARRQMMAVPFVGQAILGRVLAHRRHHDPVLGGHAAQRDRTEQMRMPFPLQDAAHVLDVHQKITLMVMA